MQRILFIVASILIYVQGFSQWIEIESTGTKVSMTSNTNGFKATSSTGEVSYVNYKLTKTSTDWVYENDVVDFISPAPGCCFIESINFINDSVGMQVINSQYNIFFSLTSDGGQSWQSADTILRFNPNQIIAINEALGYFSYNDNEHDRNYQFYKIYNGNFQMLYINDSLELGGNNIEFVNIDTGFIILNNTAKSFLFKTENGGIDWDTIFYSPNFTVNSISFGSDSVGYVAGSNGKVFKTVDYGENWSELITPAASSISCVDFFNDTVGFVVGNHGMVYKTLDGGVTWEDETINGAGDLLNVKMVDIKHAYAIDSNGKLYKQGSVLQIQEKNTVNYTLKLFPNPSNSTLNIETDKIIYEITIYDLTGKKILMTKGKLIDISELTEGIYVVVLKTKNEIYQSKFTKN